MIDNKHDKYYKYKGDGHLSGLNGRFSGKSGHPSGRSMDTPMANFGMPHRIEWTF